MTSSRFMDMQKACATCGAVMRRKKFPGGKWEMPIKFRARKFCSRKCAAAERVIPEAERQTRRTEQGFRWNLAVNFGITPEQYGALFEAQNGCCAICRSSGVKLGVDHCHATGAVRGLLCLSCNAHLGVVEKSDFVRRALEYLQQRSKPSVQASFEFIHKQDRRAALKRARSARPTDAERRAA